jgi:hypothetical protein
MDADKAEIMAKMDKLADGQEELMMSRTETMLMMAEMKSTIRSGQEETIKALREACQEATNCWLGKTKASPETTEACPVKMHACLEEEEKPAPEETEAVAEPQEVPEETTEQETIRATEDRSRNLRLAVGCRGRLKTRTKRDGRSRQECAATIGRLTRRFVPALRKGGFCRGPGMKCRRSGLKGQSKAFRNRKRVMIGKGHLERRKDLYDAVEPTLGLEIAKRVVGTSVRLREPGDWLLWKCWPPPKRKR